jgi:hypothetical protein
MNIQSGLSGDVTSLPAQPLNMKNITLCLSHMTDLTSSYIIDSKVYGLTYMEDQLQELCTRWQQIWL